MIEFREDGTIVAYFKGNFEPCPKEEAELVKVTKPDGSVRWGRPVKD